MSKILLIYQKFASLFNKQEFETEQEFDDYVKKADEWWQENHDETPEQYEQRKNPLNRPSFAGVIKPHNSQPKIT